LKKNILVIAAHPDDEVLGCGGTIAKHSKNGDIINVLLLGFGVKSRRLDLNKTNKKKDLLINATINANKILGVNNIYREDLPDNELDSISRLSIIKKIENYLEKLKPEIIYTHYYGDLNIDHRMISEAVLTATRPIPGQNVKKILFFEIASSTNWSFGFNNYSFEPNYFVNISHTLDLKLKALKFYNSEMREYPHARSLKALELLAKLRGTNVGVDAAEAFVLARVLED